MGQVTPDPRIRTGPGCCPCRRNAATPSELANLIFHLSLAGMLITIAAGRLVYYEGMVIIVTESGNYETPPAGMYPDMCERRQNQIALEGLFCPTAEWGGDNGQLLSSAYPAMRDPVVAIDVYRGDAGLGTGRAQSIFEPDSTLIANGQLQRSERVNLEQADSCPQPQRGHRPGIPSPAGQG